MENPESVLPDPSSIEEEILSIAEADSNGNIVPLRFLNSFPLPNRVDSISQAFYNNLPFIIMFKAIQPPNENVLTGQMSYQSYAEFKEQELPSLHLKTISLYNFLVDEYPGEMIIPKQNASGFDGFTGIRGTVDFFPLMAFLLELEDGGEEYLDFAGMPDLLDHYREIALENEGVPFAEYLITVFQQGAPIKKPNTEDISWMTELFKKLNELLSENEKVDWFLDSDPDNPDAPIEKVELTLDEAKQMFLEDGFDYRRLGFGESTFEMLEGEEGIEMIRQSLDGLVFDYYFEKINDSEVAYSYLLNMIAELIENTDEEEIPILKKRIKMVYRQIVLERLLYCSVREERPSLLAKILVEKKINFHNLPRIGLEQYFEIVGKSRGSLISFTAVFSTPQQGISEFQEAYSAFRENIPIISPTSFLMMILEPKPHDLVSYHGEFTERMELLDYTDGHLIETEDSAMVFFNLVQPVCQNTLLIHMNEVEEEGLEEKGMFPIPQEMYYVYLDDLVNTSFSCVHIKKKDMLNLFGLLGQPDLKAVYLNQQRLEGLFYRPIIHAIDKTVFSKEAFGTK